LGLWLDRLGLVFEVLEVRTHLSLPVTVHHFPAPRSQEQESLMRFATLYARWWPGWGRVLIGAAGLFHACMAVVLVSFPFDQLLTEGTRPIFDLWSRYVWAAAFAVVAVGIAAVLRWRKPMLHGAVWLAVTFLFGAWLTPLTVAVLDGGGSPVAVVVLLFLYGLFFAGAISNALKQR
jgi:hypothetical protein